MILASAQTKPKRGNIKENLDDHYRLVKIASDKGADLIVFPEMSITGYEREKAESLAFSGNDNRLDKLATLAVDNEIIVIAGAPVIINSDLFIGGFIILPDSSVKIYTKQFLHPGEEKYYKSFAMNVLMSNFSGESWGQPSGGRSAFWNKNGELIAAMNDSDSGLLIVEKSNDNWTGQVFND